MKRTLIAAMFVSVTLGCSAPPQNPVVSERRAIQGPLRVHPENPRYFTDDSGAAVYLAGAHTWSNLQDSGSSWPPIPFDYSGYLDFLEQHGHNFFRLWVWEQPQWTPDVAGLFWFDPMPYERTGPGLALDEKPRFDLSRFNQSYFDRLRERIVEAGRRNIYVSIMLFNGWSVEPKGYPQNPWLSHPFHRANNINGIDGDPAMAGHGAATHTLRQPAVTRLQEAYLRKVIDTVNDLDNVLYEISNESGHGSREWQYHLIRYLKSHEGSKPRQHPVGMTVEYPQGDDGALYASPADWISPRGGSLQEPVTGDGRKVILYDTDHICGICGDSAWVWKSFFRGLNPIFMDPYDGARTGVGPSSGLDPSDHRWVMLRRSLGHTMRYAGRVPLASMLPRPDLASSGYCLADVTGSRPQYLVYLPAGGRVTVDLAAAVDEFAVEWFSPVLGETALAGSVSGPGQSVFVSPFGGETVLYLH